MKKQFFFQNTHILTKSKSDSESTLINYELTAFANESDEIYILAWDSEELLSDWKKLNSSDDSHEKIELDIFLYFFVIENKANIKWIVLNPEPQINDFEKALESGVTILDLESAYGSWPVFDSYIAGLDNANDYKFYAELYAEQNKDIAPSKFLDAFGDFYIELIKFKSLSSYESQYVCEREQEHFELKNIMFFDRDKEEIVKARIDFFGHCFHMIYGIYDRELNVVFDADKILEIDVLSNKSEENKNVSFNFPDCILEIQKKYNGSLDIAPIIFEPVCLITIMSQEKIDAINNFYNQVNKKTKSIIDFYHQGSYILSGRISNNDELAVMCKNLVKKSVPNIYIDPDYIAFLDSFIYDSIKGIGRTALVSYHIISIKVARDEIKSFSESQATLQEEVLDHLRKLNILSKYICEENGYSFDIGLLSTYLLIYSYFVEQGSEEWNDRHGHYFGNVSEINLDRAIEIFVSIENINFESKESIGLFVYFLIKNNLMKECDNNYLKSLDVVLPKIDEALTNKKNNRIIDNLKRTESVGSRKYIISDIDLMNGLEFEMFISELFGIMGYISQTTKASGDQGIDVIAEKNGVTIGIQAKCYSGSVGNSAVQEAVAGKNHYRLDKVIVATNSTFTESAQKLAQSNSVLLWDRNILKEKIEDFF